MQWDLARGASRSLPGFESPAYDQDGLRAVLRNQRSGERFRAIMHTLGHIVRGAAFYNGERDCDGAAIATR
jgi:hypothetical protein